jgi:MFS family permease
LRLLIGVALTVVFILGESWINQLAVEKWRGRLVALYGTGYALSQLCGPLLLTALGTSTDLGFWAGVGLLIGGSLILLGRTGAPRVDAHSASGRGLPAFCRKLPAIAWAVMLFAAFEAMMLTLLPIYGLRQGFSQDVALFMVSVVVVGDAALQLPIGLLADRMSRRNLFRYCGVILLCSSLAIPLLLHSPLIWPLLVLFGASAGGLFTLSLILIGERYRDDELVRANAHVAQLWGIGCLIGPLATGAASQWVSGHALPLLMALGAAVFVVLAWRGQGVDDQFGTAAPARGD